jgi:hypothetical protein
MVAGDIKSGYFPERYTRIAILLISFHPDIPDLDLIITRRTGENNGRYT